MGLFASFFFTLAFDQFTDASKIEKFLPLPVFFFIMPLAHSHCPFPKFDCGFYQQEDSIKYIMVVATQPEYQIQSFRKKIFKNQIVFLL